MGKIIETFASEQLLAEAVRKNELGTEKGGYKDWLAVITSRNGVVASNVRDTLVTNRPLPIWADCFDSAKQKPVMERFIWGSDYVLPSSEDDGKKWLWEDGEVIAWEDGELMQLEEE